MENAPWVKRVEDVKFICLKLTQEHMCEVNEQFEKDADIISFHCPKFAKKGHCLNSEHSHEYLGKREVKSY